VFTLLEVPFEAHLVWKLELLDMKTVTSVVILVELILDQIIVE
jgi:hypothetical protein